MPKFRVEMSRQGTGYYTAIVEVEAANRDEAEDVAYDADKDWTLAQFDSDGTEIDHIEEVPDA